MFSILNYQPPPEEGFVEVTDVRIWSTDTYTGSWHFRRFNHLNIRVRSDNLKVEGEMEFIEKYAKEMRMIFQLLTTKIWQF